MESHKASVLEGMEFRTLASGLEPWRAGMWPGLSTAGCYHFNHLREWKLTCDEPQKWGPRSEVVNPTLLFNDQITFATNSVFFLGRGVLNDKARYLEKEISPIKYYFDIALVTDGWVSWLFREKEFKILNCINRSLFCLLPLSPLSPLVKLVLNPSGFYLQNVLGLFSLPIANDLGQGPIISHSDQCKSF